VQCIKISYFRRTGERPCINICLRHIPSKTGRRISTRDELIAAIALRHDETLVTRDLHFSEIDELEIISYQSDILKNLFFPQARSLLKMNMRVSPGQAG